MKTTINDLKTDFRDVVEESAQMLDAQTKSGDPFSEDDQKRYDALKSRRADVKGRIERAQEQIDVEKQLAEDQFAEERKAGRMKSTHAPDPDLDRDGGIKSLGQYARLVQGATLGRQDAKDAIQRAATTFQQELVGADGGYLVPKLISDQILMPALDQGNIFGRTEPMNIASESMLFPKDETAPWSSGEIETTKEGGTMTQKKSALKQFRLELFMYTRLVAVTDQLLQDVGAMTSFVSRIAQKFFAYRLSRDVLVGDGAGEMLGILNAPALVAVTRATSNLIDGVDIAKMLERTIEPANADDYVWVVHPNAFTQLMQMTFEKTTGSQTTHWPMWMIGSPGLAGKPQQTLNGWPVMRHQAAKDLGTKGDLILCDLTEYLSAMHTVGMQADTSLHLWFDQNITAFRFRLRVGGRPWLSAAIAAENGSSTLSHFVTLAA